MAGRPRVVATAEQHEELRALAVSVDSAEADRRARALLLSLEGWSSFRIAEAFSVKPDSVPALALGVRLRRGVGSAHPQGAGARPGESAGGAFGRRRGALGRGLRSTELTLPRLQDEIAARTGQRISKSRLSVVMRKEGAFAGDARGTR